MPFAAVCAPKGTTADSRLPLIVVWAASAALANDRPAGIPSSAARRAILNAAGRAGRVEIKPDPDHADHETPPRGAQSGQGAAVTETVGCRGAGGTDQRRDGI